MEELAQAYSSMNMRQFKARVTSVISESLANIREKYNQIMSKYEDGYLDDIAIEGSNKARRRAEKIIAKVRQVKGLEQEERAFKGF